MSGSTLSSLSPSALAELVTELYSSLDELLDLVPFAIDDTEREIHLRAEALIRKIKSLEASRG